MTNLEMTKSPFLLPAILAALVVGGCAQTPPRNGPTLAAEAAHYGVSQELLVKADRAGYFAEIHQGKTYFCAQQVQTFSYIPKAECFDPERMAARLQISAAALNDLQHQVQITPYDRPN